MKNKLLISALIFLITLPLVSSIADSRAGEQIKWQVISGGGQKGSSTSFVLSGSVGQTAVGTGNSTGYGLNSGFWQNFEFQSFVCGDVNSDGLVNILDIIFLIDYKFKGGPAPSILDSADVNNDSLVNILDIIYLIDYKFKGGPAPNCG